jgi:transposase-like protein
MQRSRSRGEAPYLHRRRWSDEDARAALADLEASGMGLTAFAIDVGLDAQRLTRWRRRLAAPEPTPVFEEVPFPAPAPAPAIEVMTGAEQRDSFEIVLVSGRVVRVPATFDASALGRLLAVVDGERSC